MLKSSRIEQDRAGLSKISLVQSLDDGLQVFTRDHFACPRQNRPAVFAVGLRYSLHTWVTVNVLPALQPSFSQLLAFMGASSVHTGGRWSNS